MFTPYSNVNKKQFYIKKIKSLKLTQKHFNETKSLSPIELKEFSLLYLIMNNLDIFQENIHLIENIRFFNNENKLIFEAILSKLKSAEKLVLNDLEIDNLYRHIVFSLVGYLYIIPLFYFIYMPRW